MTRFEYDTEHRAPSRVVGPDGAVVAQTLDERGLPIEIVDADGVVTRLRWDGDGQLLAAIDAFGAATTFDYDGHGLLRGITPPWGAPTVLDHDAAGGSCAPTRGDAVWEYGYTAAGRVCRGVEPGDIGWSATFGAHGAVETLTDAAGSTVEFDYDAIGNVTQVTAPDGAVVPQRLRRGRPARRRDRTERGDDGQGLRPARPGGRADRPNGEACGGGASTPSAAPSRRRRPTAQTTSFTYHPNGELASRHGARRSGVAHRARRRRTSGRHDRPGRRTVRDRVHAGGPGAQSHQPGRAHEELEYDAAGRLAAVVGVDGVRRPSGAIPAGGSPRSSSTTADGVRTARVPLGRRRPPRRSDRDGADWAAQESTIRRDAGGRVVEAIDPTGVATRFEWDWRGLLAAATDPAGG